MFISERIECDIIHRGHKRRSFDVVHYSLCNVTLFEGANKVIKTTKSLYHNNNKSMFNSKETSTWSESHVTTHDVTPFLFLRTKVRIDKFKRA